MTEKFKAINESQQQIADELMNKVDVEELGAVRI